MELMATTICRLQGSALLLTPGANTSEPLLDVNGLKNEPESLLFYYLHSFSLSRPVQIVTVL